MGRGESKELERIWQVARAEDFDAWFEVRVNASERDLRVLKGPHPPMWEDFTEVIWASDQAHALGEQVSSAATAIRRSGEGAEIRAEPADKLQDSASFTLHVTRTNGLCTCEIWSLDHHVLRQIEPPLKGRRSIETAIGKLITA